MDKCVRYIYVHTHIQCIYTNTLIHNGILHGHMNEGNPVLCDYMVDLEGIMLSEVKQTEKDISCMVSLICRL